MTQIFFYHGAANKIAAACSLLGKAANQRKSVLVYVPEPSLASDLDRQLWCSPPTGFTPHCNADAAIASETPILLTKTLENPPHEDRLMNLGQEIPPLFARFTSLIEVVGEEESDRNAARSRVRFYKDRGYAIHYIDLSLRS